MSEANTLWLNSLELMECVSNCGGAHLWEHPEDPGIYPFPSIFDTVEMCEMERRTGAMRASFDQGYYRGPAVKPTCVSSTLDGVSELDGLRVADDFISEGALGRDSDGNFRTRRLAAYPPDLCDALANCIHRTLLRFAATGGGPGGPNRPPTVAPTISARSSPSSTHHEGFSIVNETSARGHRVMIDEANTAFYLHVDDGVSMSSWRRPPDTHSADR